MQVTLTNTSTATVELPATARWTVASAREFGSASVFVPRTSAAFASAYINQDGGSLVTLRDPLLGIWQGIVAAPDIGEDGARLSAIHISKWLDLRPVSGSRVLVGYTAGAIAQQALRDGLVGLGGSVLTLGSFVEAAPHIDRYEFRGQSVYQVFTDLMNATGTQEWKLDDNGAVSWVPRIGIWWDSLLADGDFITVRRRADVSDRLTEVRGLDATGRSYTTIAGDAAAAGFWPRAAVVTATTITAAAVAAEAALAQNRTSLVTYSGQVLRSAALITSGLRVGDVVQCLTTKAGITAQTPLLRVLSISYDDTQPTIDITTQHIAPIDTTTSFRALLAGGASIPPPSPPPTTDPTPVINQTKQEVADINGRVAALEDAEAKDIPATRMSANIVTAYNAKTGYEGTRFTGPVAGTGLKATGDPGGTASQTVFTNVENTGTARGAGIGTVLFADGTSRNNIGFIKIYIGTTTYYVPVFDNP